jgi:hypothetical protein
MCITCVVTCKLTIGRHLQLGRRRRASRQICRGDRVDAVARNGNFAGHVDVLEFRPFVSVSVVHKALCTLRNVLAEYSLQENAICLGRLDAHLHTKYNRNTIA